jgi:hypothetical protein
MNGTLYPLVALFAWAVLISSVKHLPAIRKEPTRLATWYLYVCFALIFTISWAGVWNRIDTWTGLPASNVLISQCLVICYCALQTTVLELWAYAPDQARRRVKITISAYAAVLVVMITLFLRCDTADDLQQSLKAHNLQPGFNEWYGGSAEYEAYLLIYQMTISAGAVVVISLCRRYAKAISPSWLRTGLNTTAVGAALGELYSLTRLADIIAARAKVDIAPWENVAEAGRRTRLAAHHDRPDPALVGTPLLRTRALAAALGRLHQVAPVVGSLLHAGRLNRLRRPPTHRVRERLGQSTSRHARAE